MAMRELVPAATATLRTTDGRDVTLASVLPGGTPALVRANGEILLGVQLQTSSDDVSRDIGTALAAALEAPAGAPVDPGPIGAAGSAGPRLQELLDLERPVRGRRPRRLRLLAGGHRPRRRPRWPGSSTPTRRSCRPCGWPASTPRTGCGRATSAPTCAGCGPEPEEKLLDALARLSASEQILLGEGTRYAGAFRALGLVVPVWDLPADTPAEDWVEPGAGVPDPAGAGPRDDRAADLRRAPRAGRAALPADHAALTPTRAGARRSVSATRRNRVASTAWREGYAIVTTKGPEGVDGDRC